MTDPILSIPAHSLIGVIEADKRHGYLALAIDAPKVITELLFSPKTGAYIRGLAKQYQLPDEQAPRVAFAVLRVGVGLFALNQLGSLLSGELKMANDMAQKMAAELEHDLFAPVAVEMNQHLAARKQQQTTAAATAASKAGASNVLDLKNKPKPPTPPAIPRSLPRNPNNELPRL